MTTYSWSQTSFTHPDHRAEPRFLQVCLSLNHSLYLSCMNHSLLRRSCRVRFACYGLVSSTTSKSVSSLHLIARFVFIFVWVRIELRSSHSQRESVMTGIKTQILIVTSSRLYSVEPSSYYSPNWSKKTTLGYGLGYSPHNDYIGKRLSMPSKQWGLYIEKVTMTWVCSHDLSI